MARTPPLQRCFWEHLQLPLLQNHLSAPGDIVRESPFFIDRPSQELAPFGRAILEDSNRTPLPRFQVCLRLGPENFALCCTDLIRVRWGNGKIKVYDGEML